MNSESEQLNELYTALCKAQAEMEAAGKDSTNPFHKSKYADLTSIVKSSRQALTKHGLSVIQRMLVDERGQYLASRLCHTSGQWIESRMALIPPKNDIQTVGSYITYIRRYTYSALVGVITEDDDDGEKAMLYERAKEMKEESPKISREQLDVLNKEIGSMKDVLEAILKAYSISKLSDLKENAFNSVLKRVQEKKNKEPEVDFIK